MSKALTRQSEMWLQLISVMLSWSELQMVNVGCFAG